MNTNNGNIIQFVEFDFGKESHRELRLHFLYFNLKHCNTIPWDKTIYRHVFHFQGRILNFKPNPNPKEQ